MYWIEFLISAAIIVAAGIRLTVCADMLSDQMQFGKVWVGIILLGIVTSLPEAMASLTAIFSLDAYNLAVGNLLGSNNFNPMLIVVMDFIFRKGSVTNTIQPNDSHKIAARFAIILVLIVITDIVLLSRFPNWQLGSVGIGSILIIGCYFFGMQTLSKVGQGEAVISPVDHSVPQGKMSIKRIIIELFFCAVLVIIGAIWLAKSADIIAQQTGLGGTFFGSIFLALVTSLPEMVVTLSALRLGSLDLAIGNIFGSNMTNVFILSVCDVFLRKGPLLEGISMAHIATASLSVFLTYVAVKGIFARDKKSILGLGWDSLLMIVLFTVGTGILYQLRLL